MRHLLLISLTALIAASPAQSKALKWTAGPDGLPSGSKIAVVSGDPSKEGMFTIRLKFPANYAIPAHHHPADEHVTVLSGRTYYGMSDKLDRAKARRLTAGHSVVMKAEHNHWVFTRGAPTVVQVKAKGPFQITYADPKDDPRKK
jgi:quercetin dioxygenase-like cupin family protein